MSAMEGDHMSSFTILLLLITCIAVPLCNTASLLQSLDDGHQEKEGNSAAEDYMRKLYQQTADENGKPKSVTGFSSVRCFTGAVVHMLEDSYREAEEKCTNIAQFSFNLDSLADIQAIALQKGLLRVYVQMESIESANIEISARIADSKTVSVSAGTHQVTTTKDSSGWVEIPVTDGLQTLFSSNPHLDHLEVSLQAKLDCKEQGINTAIRFINPLLVIFMDTDEKIPVDELHLKETFKRSTDFIDHDDVGFGESGSGEVTPSEEPTAIDGPCQRQSFILNFTRGALFRNVGIIIVPRYVDVGYCSGSCAHSIIQTTRGRFFSFLQAPVKPCCIPSVVESLDVLSRTLSGSFQINRFSNLIVTSCGCQV